MRLRYLLGDVDIAGDFVLRGRIGAVVEKAGQTCRACLTLNPVGAPACVRCNSPLPDERQPPPPSPWANAPNSAPVHPLLPPEPPVPMPPTSAPPVPAQAIGAPGPQPFGPAPPVPPGVRRRRVLVIGNAVVLVGLLIGAAVLWFTRPHYLDTRAVARTIGKRIGATVHCPQTVHRTKGATFTCTGRYGNGRTARIKVTVRNGNGDYRWAVVRGRQGGQAG